MTDELDQVESVEAQPEEAAPEPAVESEPTTEFHHEPEFLAEAYDSEPARPQAQPEQQWSPQQVAAYQNYMAQQRQAPPQQEGTLDRLVRDPDGTLREFAGQTAQQVAYQMMQQQVVPINQQMQQFIEGQARYHSVAADDSIRKMYSDQFVKDETFASNDRVRNRVDGAIRGLRQQAMERAMMGDPTGFAVFNNPTFSKGVLALAKIMEGETPTAAEAAAVAPHTESAAPAVRKESRSIDPDTKAALERAGISEDLYLKRLEEEAKYGDFLG